MNLTSMRSATLRPEPGRAFLRLVFVALVGLFCAVAHAPAMAGSYQPDGSYTGTPSPSVVALFAAFPNGDDGLLNAIRDLLIANPQLADDIAYWASRSTPGQQADAAAGMAQAFTALNNSGNISGATRIVNAVQRSANAVLQTAMTSAVGRGALFADRAGNPITGASNCRSPVSPSAPSPC